MVLSHAYKIIPDLTGQLKSVTTNSRQPHPLFPFKIASWQMHTLACSQPSPEPAISAARCSVRFTPPDDITGVLHSKIHLRFASMVEKVVVIFSDPAVSLADESK